MALPANPSKTNTDEGTDDPKQALLTDLADLVDWAAALRAAIIADYMPFSGGNFTGTPTIGSKPVLAALTTFTQGEFPRLTANGSLETSGYGPSSFVAAAHSGSTSGHPLATGSTNGFMSAAQYNQLAALGSGAGIFCMCGTSAPIESLSTFVEMYVFRIPVDCTVNNVYLNKLDGSVTGYSIRKNSVLIAGKQDSDWSSDSAVIVVDTAFTTGQLLNIYLTASVAGHVAITVDCTPD